VVVIVNVEVIRGEGDERKLQRTEFFLLDY
jgi:hypothetical protein